jgi:hypothetical protein
LKFIIDPNNHISDPNDHSLVGNPPAGRLRRLIDVQMVCRLI